MKKSLLCVVSMDSLFIAFLMLSGLFDGVLSDVIYFTAFIIPFTVFLLVGRGQDERLRLTVVPRASALGVTFSVTAPTVLAVFALSLLSSWLVSLFSEPSTVALEGSLIGVLILHALVPSVLEEALFRYIPLTLITPHSKKCAMVISALLFALAHCNIAQLPYALVAGLIFAWCDLATGSIAPSVILHFINNVAAIVWQKYASGTQYETAFIVTLVLLALLSVIPMLLLRGRIAASLAFLKDKADRVVITREVVVYAIVTVGFALIMIL